MKEQTFHMSFVDEEKKLLRILREIITSDSSIKSKQEKVRALQKSNKIGNEKRTILLYQALLEENPRTSILENAANLKPVKFSTSLR